MFMFLRLSNTVYALPIACHYLNLHFLETRLKNRIIENNTRYITRDQTDNHSVSDALKDWRANMMIAKGHAFSILLWMCGAYLGPTTTQAFTAEPAVRRAFKQTAGTSLLPSSSSSTPRGGGPTFFTPSSTAIRTTTRLYESGGNAAIELVSTLEKLDRQWKLQQRMKPRSRWSKLVLKPEVAVTGNDNVTDDPMVERPPEENVNRLTEEFVYLLEPPNQSQPSCLIVFAGGAGLGQFPHIAYNEFLIRLSDRLNAAVIAAPYSVGLDHFGLAKTVGELSRRARVHCQEDPERLYPSTLPTYFIGHSLGCKLATIYMAAMGQSYDGMGFMSFNNFGFSQTVGMVKQFAEEIQKSTGIGQPIAATRDLLNQVFSFAETIVGSIGLDFSPNTSETERMISMKFDEEQQAKTRLFVFDDDTLDSTPLFVQACPGAGPTVSYSPGSHLTPVYFKLGLDELPAEARELASGALGGFKTASFGNEEELNALVDEMAGWMLGKAPSRPNKLQQPLLVDALDKKD
jgi:hypothetical protein